MITSSDRDIADSGFTLIELSIVLVIIGLIVGGILTGRDLIDAAAQRAQVTQIQRYNVAARTFQVKYGYLPGDIPDPYASQFGFQARGTHSGQGDGNGVIETYEGGNGTCGFYEGTGETTMFWVDLSAAGLIDGGFNTATPGSSPPINNITDSTSPSLSAYFPKAKIGNGNYVYVWSGGWAAQGWPFCQNPDGQNYFAISLVTPLMNWGVIEPTNTAMTVQQAYNIDSKIDDGLPQSGRILALYLTWIGNCVGSGSVEWAAGNNNCGAENAGTYGPTTAATPYAPTNCYDNNNVAGPQKYSTSQNGNTQNCALSIRFQ